MLELVIILLLYQNKPVVSRNHKLLLTKTLASNSFFKKIATIKMVVIHCATRLQSLQSCRRILLYPVVLQWPEVHLQFS